jgi:predicted  nucleic acid-binding Zn-ribbon protein
VPKTCLECGKEFEPQEEGQVRCPDCEKESGKDKPVPGKAPA